MQEACPWNSILWPSSWYTRISNLVGCGMMKARIMMVVVVVRPDTARVEQTKNQTADVISPRAWNIRTSLPPSLTIAVLANLEPLLRPIYASLYLTYMHGILRDRANPLRHSVASNGTMSEHRHRSHEEILCDHILLYIVHGGLDSVISWKPAGDRVGKHTYTHNTIHY